MFICDDAEIRPDGLFIIPVHVVEFENSLIDDDNAYEALPTKDPLKLPVLIWTDDETKPLGLFDIFVKFTWVELDTNPLGTFVIEFQSGTTTLAAYDDDSAYDALITLDAHNDVPVKVPINEPLKIPVLIWTDDEINIGLLLIVPKSICTELDTKPFGLFIIELQSGVPAFTEYDAVNAYDAEVILPSTFCAIDA